MQDIAVRTCNTQPCPTWTEWEGWSPCNTVCSFGSQQRVRHCSDATGCPGTLIQETRLCYTPCANFEDWAVWSQGTLACTFLQQWLLVTPDSLNCLNSDGTDATAVIPATDTTQQWTSWTQCQENLYWRAAKPSADTCYTAESKWNYEVPNASCPDPGPCQWTAWSSYSSCSKTCNGGTMHRSRTMVGGSHCSCQVALSFLQHTSLFTSCINCVIPGKGRSRLFHSSMSRVV